MYRRATVLLPVLLCPALLAAAEPAEVVVVGESRASFAKLEEARKMTLSPKRNEGLTALGSLSDNGGNELAQLKGARSVQTRLLAQRYLSRLPRLTLDIHRRRTEPAARRLLFQSLEEGNPALLMRVVEEAFCTRAAMQALDVLGDLMFERGRFGEAELWWRLLSPLGGRRDTDELLYPDPPADTAARVEAKQMLARLFAGRSSVAADLTAYRRAHPKAEGRLAGQKGVYADILAALVKERAERPAEQAGDWTTFAGNAARHNLVPAGEKLLDHVSRIGRSGPAWRFDLQRRDRLAGPLPVLPQTEVDAARRMAFHPAVVGDVALVADARYVTAYDLRTGKAQTWFDLEEQVGGVKVTLSTPAIADLRYTLTVADDAVFARLGCQAIRDVRPDPKTGKADEGGESVLVSLALKPKQGGERKRWMVRAIDPGRKEFAVFEGAPVVALGRVWIAASRFEGGKVVTAIHCYPADPEDSAPVPLWRTDVCQTSELQAAGGEDENFQRRHRHHLLTLAGPRIVYCSHSGVIAALDARTGRYAWAIRYPRRDAREPEDQPALRDLAPPLFANGKVYVAPADSERLYCLDPLTGAVIWQRDRLEVVQLLGVGSGRLIFTTYRNPRQGSLHAGGLRAVSADDGGDEGGWQLPDDGGGLIPLGRGLLVGDLVLWPTDRRPCGVIAVRQEDGRQPDNPSLLHRIPAGNLVYANDHLLVADQRTLWAFVPPERLHEEDEKAALDLPRELLRRARAAAGRGERDKALERFDAVIKMTDMPRRFLDEVRHERQAVLIDAAKEAVKRKKTDEAVRWLDEAAKGSTGQAKLHALVSAAELWTAAGDTSRAVKAWQAVRELGEGMVEDGRGRPQSAVRMAALRIKPVDDKTTAARRAALREGLKAARDRPAVSLSLPLRAVLSLTLPDEERFLPLAEVGRSIASVWSYSDKGELVCRSREAGAERWRSPVPFAPAWLADGGPVVLAAGPRGVAAFDGTSGERLWHFGAPPRRRYPRAPSSSIQVPSDVQPGDDLSHFHLAGTHLVFVQGGHTLFGMDLLRGEVRWQRRPVDAGLGLPAPYGMVHHLLPLDDNHVLAQVSGRRMLLDAPTGRIEEEDSDLIAPWPRPPVRLPGGDVLVVPDAQRVQRLDPLTMKVRWTFTPPGKTTRTGGPPLAVSDGERVVVVVPENLGLRLVRLDPVLGKVAWSRLVEGDPDRLADAGWCLDAERLYHADGRSVRSWAVVDGKPGWNVLLPEGFSWWLARSGATLLAWPARVNALAFRFRWLTGTLQWQSGPFPPADAVLPLLCLDAASGELVQRLNLPADRPTARTVRLDRRGLFPSLEAGRTPDDGLAVRWDGRGLIFALAGQVRVLEDSPK